MREDYVDAIRELLPYIPPECLAVPATRSRAPDQELVDKVHERAAVSRARATSARQAVPRA